MLERSRKAWFGAGRMAVQQAGATPRRFQELAPSSTGRTSAATAEPTAAAASAAAQTKPEIMESTRDREFICATEVHYHGSRQAFFEGAHRWAMFFVIVLGAAAITPFGSEKAFALIATVFAAADIAFDLTGRAQKHADFRRRYLDLVADLSEGLEEERLNFDRRLMAISADEPPPYRWVQEIAHRNAAISLGRVEPDALPLWKGLAAQFWRA